MNNYQTMLQRRRNKNRLMYAIAAAIVLSIIGAIFGVGYAVSHSSVETTTITVKEKERVCESSNNGSNCRYLIFTENGVYENVDSLFHMKFNGSDIYNELEAGRTYEARINWYRVPFFSMYQNILQVKEVQ